MKTTVIVPNAPKKKVKILPDFPALYKSKLYQYIVLATSRAGGMVVVNSIEAGDHPVGYVFRDEGVSWADADSFERITEPTTIKFED